MPPPTLYRQWLLVIEGRQRRRPFRALPIREPLAALMLGVLSVSLGIVGLTTVPAEMAGRAPGSAAPDGFLACLVGSFLGMAGIIVAWRRGRVVSILSVFGTVICAVPFGSVLLILWAAEWAKQLLPLLFTWPAAMALCALFCVTISVWLTKHLDRLLDQKNRRARRQAAMIVMRRPGSLWDERR